METWLQYLNRVGVTGDGVELCKQCTRTIGTVQMFEGKRGVLVPVYKFCDECHAKWKRYAKLVVR